MAIALESRGLVMRIEMGKTCLDNILHLHVVFAQIHFRL
jgi:hypothetical protein